MKRTKNLFNKLRLSLGGYLAKKQLLCKKDSFCNCSEDLTDLCVSCRDANIIANLTCGEPTPESPESTESSEYPEPPELCTIALDSTSPADLDVDINVGSVIRISSTEAIDPTHPLNTISVTVGGLQVAGDVVYITPTQTRFVPYIPMSYDSTYIVTYVLYGLDGCKITGTFSFSTVACALGCSYIPLAGATGVSITTDISLSFTEDIDPATFVFELTPGATTILGTGTRQTASIYVFSPNTDLAQGTTYTVHYIADSTETQCGLEDTFTFTTA